jgi:hypothetical protein
MLSFMFECFSLIAYCNYLSYHAEQYMFDTQSEFEQIKMSNLNFRIMQESESEK